MARIKMIFALFCVLGLPLNTVYATDKQQSNPRFTTVMNKHNQERAKLSLKEKKKLDDSFSYALYQHLIQDVGQLSEQKKEEFYTKYSHVGYGINSTEKFDINDTSNTLNIYKQQQNDTIVDVILHLFDKGAVPRIISLGGYGTYLKILLENCKNNSKLQFIFTAYEHSQELYNTLFDSGWQSYTNGATSLYTKPKTNPNPTETEKLINEGYDLKFLGMRPEQLISFFKRCAKLYLDTGNEQYKQLMDKCIDIFPRTYTLLVNPTDLKVFEFDTEKNNDNKKENVINALIPLSNDFSFDKILMNTIRHQRLDALRSFVKTWIEKNKRPFGSEHYIAEKIVIDFLTNEDSMLVRKGNEIMISKTEGVELGRKESYPTPDLIKASLPLFNDPRDLLYFKQRIDKKMFSWTSWDKTFHGLDEYKTLDAGIGTISLHYVNERLKSTCYGVNLDAPFPRALEEAGSDMDAKQWLIDGGANPYLLSKVPEMEQVLPNVNSYPYKKQGDNVTANYRTHYDYLKAVKDVTEKPIVSVVTSMLYGTEELYKKKEGSTSSDQLKTIMGSIVHQAKHADPDVIYSKLMGTAAGNDSQKVRFDRLIIFTLYRTAQNQLDVENKFNTNKDHGIAQHLLNKEDGINYEVFIRKTLTKYGDALQDALS